MRCWTKRWRPLLALLPLLVGSCGEVEAPGPAPATLHILPLGDSITEGYPHHYRHELSRYLQGDGYRVRFVGSQLDRDPGAPADTDGRKPRHEGHSGWTTAMLAAQLPDWLPHYHTDVVLLHIGTNDAFATSPPAAGRHVAGMLDTLLAHHADVTILLAKIIPLGPGLGRTNRWIESYNRQLEEITQRYRHAGHAVFLVDHNSAFDPTWLPDDVHPDAVGAMAMARVWYGAIRALFDPPAGARHGTVAPEHPATAPARTPAAQEARSK